MNATVAVLERQEPKKAPARRLIPKPSRELRYHLREAARHALDQNLTYEEAQQLFRYFLIDSALVAKGGNKTEAGKTLGISRDHVRDYHKRLEEFL